MKQYKKPLIKILESDDELLAGSGVTGDGTGTGIGYGGISDGTQDPAAKPLQLWDDDDNASSTWDE